MNRTLWFTSSMAGTGATLAIMLLSGLQELNSQWALLMAPFGASTVLLFGLPESPLARAKNVIFGHAITATIGLLFLHLITVTGVTMSIATGLAVMLMMLTKTTHPPAGANPLLIMLTGQSWWFLLDPVLLGSILLVSVAKLYQLLRSYFQLV